MDYKKKYEEALSRARAFSKRWQGIEATDSELALQELKEIFPELKESDDERIRNLIYCLIRDRSDNGKLLEHNGCSVEKALAWLEKQGKQKPQGKQALELWKDMRLEVYQQASGNRHEPNYSDDNTKMFSLTDIDEIFEKVAEKQGKQSIKMIQWKGDNLREVIEFTGKSPKFNEWFKTWDDFENYVHSHGNIFKLFCEDGSHYEVPVGAWIVKTPDGYNVASKATFVKKLSNNQSSLVIDKKLLNEVIECLKYLNYWVCGGNDTIINKLKRLKPQSCCKPSDEKSTGKPKVYDSMDDLIADALIEEIEGSDLPASSKHNRIFWIKSHRQRSAWSEEDTKLLNLSLENLTELKNRFGEKYGKVGYCISWLKSLKNRVQPQLKQEWGEDDKLKMDTLIHVITNQKGSAIFEGLLPEELVNWLESIKERYTWKPSDEQMEALLKLEEMHVLEHEKNQENAHLYMVIKSLKEQLLKLKENKI